MTVKNNIPAPKQTPKRLNLWWFVIISVLFCELMGYTWVRTESTQVILKVSSGQEEFAAKKSYHKALSVERDRLKSDDRITRIAKTRLNLSTDTAEQTIYLSSSLPGDKG